MKNVKKTIALLICIILCVAVVSVPAQAFFKPMVQGDINGDKKCNSDDLVTLKGILLGALDETDVCDGTDDGDVNILDFIMLKKFISGDPDAYWGNIGGDSSGDIEIG